LLGCKTGAWYFLHGWHPGDLFIHQCPWGRPKDAS
jgi:hypothetical protein